MVCWGLKGEKKGKKGESSLKFLINFFEFAKCRRRGYVEPMAHQQCPLWEGDASDILVFLTRNDSFACYFLIRNVRILGHLFF